MDEKPYKYENLPIPSYEEATSSRPTSSQSRGPQEISDDAERQGLLNTRRNYEPPTVESQRSSLDSLDGIEIESEAEVRREMQEMDYEDPNNSTASNRSLLTYRFKAFTNFTNSFPSLSLPSFKQFIPKIDWQAMDANRIVILGRMFGIFLIMGLVYVLVASDILTFGKNRMGMGTMYDPESVRAFVQGGFRERMHIEHNLKHITKFPHLAGSEGNYVLGEWVAEMFKKHELEEVNMERFDVYLNYPIRDGGRQVAIVEPEDQKWEARIEEDGEEDLAFHGHSASGEVTGPLVYANFGSRQDFQRLKDEGVSIQGAIVLVRYYGSQISPGLKILAAQDEGAAGVIIYSDPAQDGMVQGPEYPDGRFMPQDGIQRTTVSLISKVIGDVLSPGWASTPGNPQRLQPEESKGLVNIPSLPLSWRDASHLLQSLQGHGKKMDGDWTGAPNTEYWTGNQDSPKVKVKNMQDEARLQPIYNVVGKITGWEQPTHKIIVGNHRDAWCLGAADPGSGTAVMIAMTRIFGALRRLGWRPLRTIEFVSWDAGEYNAVGSTEHVENREEELRNTGVAYINVDTGVTGMDFRVGASPVFEESLRRVLGRVSDPYSNKTIREVWENKNIQISPIAADGDCTPFQHITGTSSINLGFTGEHYPKGSCYDNYDWMSRFGDLNSFDDTGSFEFSPAFDYSAALGEIWALLVLDLSDGPLLPLDIDKYIDTLAKYVDDLGAEFSTKSLDIQPLQTALTNLRSQAQLLDIFEQEWHTIVYTSGGFEGSAMTRKRIARNNAVSNFEAKLLDTGNESSTGGLVNRTQYKHLVTAPKLWDPTQVEVFPSVRQWMDLGDFEKAQQEVNRVAEILENAAQSLSI